MTYRINTQRGAAREVITSELAESPNSGESFATAYALAEATIQAGYPAASAIILSDLLRAQEAGSIGGLFALRDLIQGNASAALTWCSMVHQFQDSTSRCMMIEALARIYLGEPERAAGISRELLRVDPSEEAYSLLAEATIRQRELLHAYEITAEGLMRYNDSIMLRHLQRLAIRGIDQNHLDIPGGSADDSMFVNETRRVADRLIWIMFSAPFRPSDCEKIWWDMVYRFSNRPVVWLAGAWIARHMYDSAIARHRLRRALRTGISEDAVFQDIRFTDIYVKR